MRAANQQKNSHALRARFARVSQKFLRFGTAPGILVLPQSKVSLKRVYMVIIGRQCKFRAVP